MAERRHAFQLLAGLFLAAIALRPQLVGIAPLLGTIQHSFGVSHSVAGLLSTIVVLCMGLLAPASFRVGRAVGVRAAIAGSLCLIAVFGAARALVPHVAALLALTLPVGVGVAVAGSLMPLVVKESWPGRPVLATGIYTTGVSIGAALSAALAIPLSHLLWGWRGSLLAFSAATAALAVGWLALTRRHPPHSRPAGKLPPLPLREPVAWLLVAIFTFVAIAYYGTNAWLPAAYVEHGWSRASAGNLLTVMNGVTVPISIALAWHGDSFGSRRAYIALGGLLTVAGVVGTIELPAAGWLWAVALGSATGVLFPSIMTLPIDAARSAGEVGAMAALMLGAGYTLGALAPFALGALRDWRGSFGAALWIIVADAILLVAAALAASRERLAPRRESPGLESS